MHRYLEFILVLIWVVFSAGLVWTSANSNTARANTEFAKISEDGVQDVRTRLQRYFQALQATAAHIRTTEDPDQRALESYLSRWDFGNTLPGITGIIWIVPVDHASLENSVAEIVRQGEKNFKVHPSLEVEDHYVLRAIYPPDGNDWAVGLDLAFESGLRKALTVSRQTGEPRMTSRIELIQDHELNPDFMLLLPINPDAKESDGQRFQGWVAAPFVGKNLLTNVTTQHGSNYTLEVFDGLDTETENLIYGDDKASNYDGKYQATYELDQFNRTWTVRFQSTAEFEENFFSFQPMIIAAISLLLTFLLLRLLKYARLRTAMLSEISAMRFRQVEARRMETSSIMENDVIPVLILDGQKRILSLNSAAQNTFGYCKDAAIGLAFEELVETPEAKRLDADEPAIGYTRTGSTLLLDVECNAWSTADGDARITAIVRDVTSEKSALSRLLHMKTLYDMALRGARIGVFEVDLRTGKSEVSDTWYQVMGLDKKDDELDTQAIFYERMHPEDRPNLKKSDRECIDGTTKRSVSEFRLAFGPNEWRWMRSDAVVSERDANGRAVHLIGTQTDVTDLVHARNALEASEELFRSVLASAPIGMALMNQEGGFIGVNDAFCELCGLSEKELINNKRLNDLLPKEELKKIYATVSGMLQEAQGGIYSAEHRLLSGGSRERWGEFHVGWSRNKNTNSDYFIAQVIDITKRKELDRIKGEFVSTVSHELRTPLTSIKGALDLIGAKGRHGFDASTGRLLDIATTNAQRLTVIVNDILDLERISAGDLSFESEETDLGGIVDAVLRDLEPYALVHKNTLHRDLPSEPVSVMVDPNRSVQVLTNLVSNACKFSDENSEVSVTVEVLGEVAIVFVKNIGPGVPENFQSEIFKAFTQADSSDTRAAGGTGLGLNIAQAIVEKQGGRIGFKSTQGGVTVFWFTCPLAIGEITAQTPVTVAATPRQAIRA